MIAAAAEGWPLLWDAVGYYTPAAIAVAVFVAVVVVAVRRSDRSGR